MLKAFNLTKHYGDRIAADNLCFEIAVGEIVGLLGPNGAGKTTTLNMLTGCLAPTSGGVTVDVYDMGRDSRMAARHIGFLPDNPPLYGEMTVRAYLDFVYGIKDIRHPTRALRREHIANAARAADIADVFDRVCGNLSRGYRQRVGLAAAMLGDPDVLILDEPTTGLDPLQTKDLRKVITKLGKNRAVLLSTHILSEAVAICSRVILLANGKIAADAPPDKLKPPTKKEIAARRELLKMMTPEERRAFELGRAQIAMEDAFAALTEVDK